MTEKKMSGLKLQKNNSQSIFGVFVIIFGIAAITLSIIITPTLATRYLSPDHNISPQGIILLNNYRLTLSIGGMLLFVIGVIFMIVKNLGKRILATLDLKNPVENKPISKYDNKVFILFTVFIVAFSVFISIKNIGNGFFWDDYNLIRPYTSSELRMAWHGNWEPDQFGTPGYRPLTPFFYDLQYRLFGENVVAYRVFLVLLFVIVLVAWGRFLRKIGLSNLIYLCISLLVLSARNSAYHFHWITDGNHLFQGILFIACIWLIYFSVNQSRRFYSFIFSTLSLVIYALSLLVREESVIIFGAAFLLYFYLLYSNKEKHTWQSIIDLLIYLMLGSGITLFILYLGKIYVPHYIGIDLLGPQRILKFTIFLAGFRGGNLYYLVAALPIILVSITFFHALFNKRTINSSRYILFFVLLILVIIGCMPGLVKIRSNLTFFSTLFYCTWLGTAISIFLEHFDRPNLKMLQNGTVVLFLIPILITNISSSLALQESTAYPICYMLNSVDYIWGVYKSATTPEVRLTKTISELNKLGITQENYVTEIPRLICDAYRKGISHPTLQGNVFFPEYYLFSDDWPDWPLTCK